MINARVKNAGYVVVAVAGSLLVFCAVLGLAIDIGFMYVEKQRMQAAADSAALAGAREIQRGNLSTVTSAADTESTTNGYTTGVNGTTVTVNRPPATGIAAGDPYHVEVIVARAQPTFFMKALGTTTVTTQARAVAGLESTGKCMFVLDPSASNAFVVSGGGAVNVPCGIVVNSTSSTALVASGGSCFTATTIEVGGGYTGGCYTPTPTTGVAASDDPLLYVTAPTAAAGCDLAHTNWSHNSGTWNITAGTYCGGITLTGGATLNLGAGTYILKGGGLLVQNNGTTINGAGVTFYNTCTIGTCPGGTFAAIEIKSGATANLSAPTAGSLANMLFFVDRNASSSIVNMFSASTFTFTGTIYAKTQKITFSGQAVASALKLNIVSRLLLLSGTSTLNLTHNFAESSAIKEAAMME